MQEISWWRTELGDDEWASVADALRRRRINSGPGCRQLEKRLASQLGVPHVVTCGSGSDALVMALMACGVGLGDEVILPACTFIASAHAVKLLGGNIRLVDVCRGAPVIDPTQAAQAVNSKTKAIIAVHLNGRACQMSALRDLARDRGIGMIEDCAQAFCSKAEYGYLGAQADTGCYSLGMTKLVTTGEGGFVTCTDEKRYREMLSLRNQGRNVETCEYDSMGYNFKLTDMQAALAIPQLDRLADRIKAVNEVHAFYCEQLEGLRGIKVMRVRQGEVPLYAEVVCSDRDKVRRALEKEGIGTSPYLPCLSTYLHLDAGGVFPHAEFFCDHVLILPSGTHQAETDLRRVADVLRGMDAGLECLPPGGVRD